MKKNIYTNIIKGKKFFLRLTVKEVFLLFLFRLFLSFALAVVFDFLVIPTVLLFPMFLKLNHSHVFDWISKHYDPIVFFKQALDQHHSLFWSAHIIFWLYVLNHLFRMISKEIISRKIKNKENETTVNTPTSETLENKNFKKNY